MRIVFAGTPEFAAVSLRALLVAGRRPVAVYTQPDRPSGRGRLLTASAIKQVALAAGLPVEQPAALRDPATQETLAAHAPDLLVVAAYGLLLPARVLALPRLGCVNVHASLLPRWRGAAPIQRAVLAGDATTGITLMRMVEGLDAGPMLAQGWSPIGPTDTAATVHDRLAQLGARMLCDMLPVLEGGIGHGIGQEPRLVTYARKFGREEARLDWRLTAAELARAVRGYNPAPVAHAELAGTEIRIWEALAIETAPAGAPGTILAAGATGIDVATGAGCLRILRLQASGRQPVSARDYVNGHPDLVPAR